MNLLFILGFALSSSLDNLGVGITYGIRKINISAFSNTLISAICFIFSYLGIIFGKWVSTIIPGRFPVFVSAIFLFAIGFRVIWFSLPHKQKIEKEQAKMKGFASIFENPECVDFDNSKDIEILEALVLGVALSANALSNGLSAGLLGYTPFVLSFSTAVGSFLAMWFGVNIGQKFADIRIGSFKLGQFGTLISGILLVLIAIKSFI